MIAVFRPTRQGDADAVLRCVRILRAVQAVIERRNCGTGAGGFKPGNSCGKGDGGGGDGSGSSTGSGGGSSPSGGGSVRDTALDAWRKRDEPELGSFRKRIADADEFADTIIADSQQKRDKMLREQAQTRDTRDGLKEKSKESIKKLDEAAKQFGDEALKERLSTMDDIRRQLFLENNPHSDPRIEEVRQARLAMKKQLQESSAKLLDLSQRIDSEEEFIHNSAKDRRVAAWNEIAKYSAQTATDSLEKDGDAYSPELFSKVRDRFSGEMQSVFVTGTVSPDDLKRFEDGPKKEAAEFLAKVVNPASKSASSMAQASINISNIDRAYASGDTVHVSAYSSTSTLVHELGHIYESSDPNIRDAAVAFQRHRCDESQNVKMSKLSQSSGYADSEVGNTDNFRKVVEAVYASTDPYEDAELNESRIKTRSAYLGKAYKDKSGDTVATELISIGFELMHHNPAAFAKADPEYFDFMLGVVSGKIRRARKRKT